MKKIISLVLSLMILLSVSLSYAGTAGDQVFSKTSVVLSPDLWNYSAFTSSKDDLAVAAWLAIVEYCHHTNTSDFQTAIDISVPCYAGYVNVYSSMNFCFIFKRVQKSSFLHSDKEYILLFFNDNGNVTCQYVINQYAENYREKLTRISSSTMDDNYEIALSCLDLIE